MDLVYNFLENEIKLNKNDSVVVGVSAGPDSMFLLYILLELRKKIGFQIIVAHINHNVRIESIEEEAFLKQYCKEHDVMFEGMKIDKYEKENFHAYARNIRYQFYKDLVNKYKANYLMTAHHGDDLMETILMRLSRGSSLFGYQGISLISNMNSYLLVRPLLFLTKDEIKDYNDKLNIPYRIDKSNISSKYTRNRYRMNILPFLKEENKDVHLKFLKFSRLLEESNNYISKIVNNIYNKVYNNGCLDVLLLKQEDTFIIRMVFEKVLKNIYHDLSLINDKHLDSLINLIKRNKTGTSLNLPNKIIVKLDYGILKFETIKEQENYCVELIDGLIISNGMKFVKLEDDENGNDTLHLESKNIKLPLYVRNKRDGDIIELKGMKGSKKVSDIFIDNKINKTVRLSYPIVVDSDNRVIWIPKLKKSKYDSQNHEKCDIIFKCL